MQNIFILVTRLDRRDVLENYGFFLHNQALMKFTFLSFSNLHKFHGKSLDTVCATNDVATDFLLFR